MRSAVCSTVPSAVFPTLNRILHFHLNVVTDNANRNRARVELGCVLVEVGPVANAETPVVNPTADGIAFDQPVGE